MKTVWDFWANYYNRLWVQKYSLKPGRDKVISIIKKIGFEEGSLLDIGCGTGQLLERIHAEFGDKILLTGADYSKNMLKQAKKNLKTQNIKVSLHVPVLGTTPRIKVGAHPASLNLDRCHRTYKVKLIHTDVNDIKENVSNKFDIITCTHSLPYYKNQEKAIFDMADLLKDKGYIIVICASVNNIYDRLVCSILKLTTGRAHYPSVKELKGFAKNKLKCIGFCIIKKAFFMPNIVAVVYKRK